MNKKQLLHDRLRRWRMSLDMNAPLMKPSITADRYSRSFQLSVLLIKLLLCKSEHEIY